MSWFDYREHPELDYNFLSKNPNITRDIVLKIIAVLSKKTIQLCFEIITFFYYIVYATK